MTRQAIVEAELAAGNVVPSEYAPFAAAVTVFASVNDDAPAGFVNSCTETGAPALPVTVKARCA
jgi:hypothetical protein